MAGERSRVAQEKVELTQVIVGESRRSRRRTENLLLHALDRFNRTQIKNAEDLAEMTDMLDEMYRGIPDLNEQVAYMKSCLNIIYTLKGYFEESSSILCYSRSGS